MNKVYLIGNLTRDPELSETNSGVAYCRFSIAVNRNYANADGNREADFFNVIAWRGQAETCGRFLKKGSKIAVIGSLQNRSYEDKDGVKRTVTDVILSEFEFLSSNARGEDEVQEGKTIKKVVQLEEVDNDSDLPF